MSVVITLPSISSGYFDLRLFSFLSIAALISSRRIPVFILPTVCCFVASSGNLIIYPMEAKGCCFSGYSRIFVSLSGMAGDTGDTFLPRFLSPNIFFTFATIWSESKSPTTTTAWFWGWYQRS